MPTQAQIREAWQAWVGGAKLRPIAQALGYKESPPLRKDFIALFGVAEYRRVQAEQRQRREAQQTARREQRKGRVIRKARGRREEVDDSVVRVITSARTADGWRVRPHNSVGYRIIDPTGRVFIPATEHQRADLIYERQGDHVPPAQRQVRLREVPA